MEIFPHIYQIPSLVADRDLFQYLFVGDNIVLLDTGASYTPEQVILPFLEKHHVSASRLKIAINTHADADHHGGNSALKNAAPDLLLGCGDFDRAMIEDPDHLFATRYNHWLEDHGIGLSQFPEGSAWVRKMAGPAHRIDVTFRGGEQISLDDKHSLRVLHVPGHSDGHLALYHPGMKAVFVGDALHGNYCPTAEGKPSLPPAYFAVLAYLGTLQFLEALDIEWIYSGHWPTYHAAAAKDFLAESRRFVDKASALVMKNLENHPEGVTLLSCIAECGPAMGAWPATNQWLLMYPLHGHLLHLEQLGVTTRIEDDGHVRWRLAA